MFNEHGRTDTQSPHLSKIHELYGHAKALFDLVAPQEYGIDPDEKSVIVIMSVYLVNSS